MSLRKRIFKALLRRTVTQRDPDFVIGGTEHPYLNRWWVLPRNRWFNVYLHQFLRSDDDRALHDHPWLFNASWLMNGAYDEVTPLGKMEMGGVQVNAYVTKRLEEGNFKFRWGAAPHRVQLLDARWEYMKAASAAGMLNAGLASASEHLRGKERSCWTLFITGPVVREWGFLCPQGWRHWKEFTSERDKGSVGRGCE